MTKRKHEVEADSASTEAGADVKAEAQGNMLKICYGGDGSRDFVTGMPTPEDARRLAVQIGMALKVARDSLAAEYGMTPEEAKALHTSHVEDVKEEEP